MGTKEKKEIDILSRGNSHENFKCVKETMGEMKNKALNHNRDNLKYICIKAAIYV